MGCQSNTTEETAIEVPEKSKPVETEHIPERIDKKHDHKFGLAQSPVNIISDKTEGGKHNVTFHFNDEINKIENLGHTIQLDFKPGSTIEKDGNTYEFKQLHFHTPSEHRIDGKIYAMEMHVVNVLTDSINEKAAQYLVLAMLFEEGEANPFIGEFVGSIPEEEHTTDDLMPGSVKLLDLISDMPEEELSECYHYSGSLTTAPYTESVNWYISKNIYKASKPQIDRIGELEGNNARHIQDLHDRMVKSE